MPPLFSDSCNRTTLQCLSSVADILPAPFKLCKVPFTCALGLVGCLKGAARNLKGYLLILGNNEQLDSLAGSTLHDGAAAFVGIY